MKYLLVQNAGELRSFHLVRDKKDHSSHGSAFCEFATFEGLKQALNKLNHMKVRYLTPEHKD